MRKGLVLLLSCFLVFLFNGCDSTGEIIPAAHSKPETKRGPTEKQIVLKQVETKERSWLASESTGSINYGEMLSQALKPISQVGPNRYYQCYDNFWRGVFNNGLIYDFPTGRVVVVNKKLEPTEGQFLGWRKYSSKSEKYEGEYNFVDFECVFSGKQEEDRYYGLRIRVRSMFSNGCNHPAVRTVRLNEYDKDWDFTHQTVKAIAVENLGAIQDRFQRAKIRVLGSICLDEVSKYFESETRRLGLSVTNDSLDRFSENF